MEEEQLEEEEEEMVVMKEDTHPTSQELAAGVWPFTQMRAVRGVGGWKQQPAVALANRNRESHSSAPIGRAGGFEVRTCQLFFIFLTLL